MTRNAALRPITADAPTWLRRGARLRQLRVAAGLTQSELAGERFSKEYLSQIERGKTRPTDETIGWLASRPRGRHRLPLEGPRLGGSWPRRGRARPGRGSARRRQLR